MDAGDGTRSMVAVDDDNKVIGLIINPISSRTGIQYRAGDVMLTEFIPIRSGPNAARGVLLRSIAIPGGGGGDGLPPDAQALPCQSVRPDAQCTQLHLH